MPRIPNDAAITTKAARTRLAMQDSKPHWKSIAVGLALGWRRGVQGGGTWVARVMLDGRYREGRLAAADDVLPADGSTVLTFAQAQTQAVAWAARQRRIAAGEETAPVAPAAPFTVADAIALHLADLAHRGSRGVAVTATAANAHITPALGSLPMAKLTADKLRAWRDALADAPPRRRTSAKAAAPGKPAISPAPPVGKLDADSIRRRRATANRILTILKAALTFARKRGRYIGSDDPWRLVEPFGKVDTAKVRWLTDDEQRRLVNACPPDFRALVTAALLTGCRYGELAAAKVGDLDCRAGALHIPMSKSGKARHVFLTDEGRAFFGRIALGKEADARLFERDRLEGQATKARPATRRRAAVEAAPAMTRRATWGKSDQFRWMAAACAAARITPAVSFHVLRHSYATRLASNGAQLLAIAAQLGHADTRTTEKHYAHAAPSYVADTVRAAFGNLGIGTQQQSDGNPAAITREFVPGRVA